MLRASVLAKILGTDTDTQAPKPRSIGGYLMLIRPDGTYELYDWNPAKSYFWEEQVHCPDPQTFSGAKVMLYTIDETYWNKK